MAPYPKQILTIPQQLQSYMNAGMQISSQNEVIDALQSVGYYRLRGYSFHLYDNKTKKYHPGINFSDVLKLYHFDRELSHLLFGMASSIEVALRCRLCDAMLVHGDALILTNPSYFSDKQLFWKNLATLSNEISRSNDVFIRHNYENHNGEIPLWAAVEVTSFGTLSKIIKNLQTGTGSAFSSIASHYCYQSAKGKPVTPSHKMLCSWIQAVVVLRNICAHNSRIYNRTISTHPTILIADQITPVTPNPQHNGLYQILLAMKYLRPSDDVWKSFFSDMQSLFAKYQGCFDYGRMNFPADWQAHLQI